MNDTPIKSGKYDWPKAVDCSTTPYFFISYSHRNSVLACHDFSMLNSYEIPFWYDDGMVPGQDWKEKAKYAMNHANCKGVIFYISKASVMSNAVYEELKMAAELMDKKEEFSIFSVNIGGKSIESMIKEGLVPQKYCELYKRIFPDSTIFIGRKSRVSSTEHLCYLLDYFNNRGLLKKKYLSVVERNPFVLAPYEDAFIITKFKGEAEEIVIPEAIGKKRVIAIGPNAFANNTKIKKLDIRGGIVEIFDSAFEGCSNLSSVSFDDSLLRIGNDAFNGCKKIKSLVFPTQLKELGSYAFYQCGNLTTVDFNHASLSIGYACFSQCVKLAKIRSEENLVTIEGYAFGGSSFDEFHIYDKVERLGTDCFVFNPNLQYIYFKSPRIPQDMASSIVALCPKFKHLVVPVNTPQGDFEEFKKRELVKKRVQPVVGFSNDENGFLWKEAEGADEYRVTVGNKNFVTRTPRLSYSFDRKSYYISIVTHSFDEEIEDAAVSFNYEIKTPIIENEELCGGSFNSGIIGDIGVKSIGERAFAERLDIKALNFSGNLIKKSAFESALNLVSIHFKNNVALEDAAFRGCGKLTDVNFDKIYEMGQMCFENCLALDKVILSKNITRIPAKAFRRSIGLKEIVFSESLKRIDSEALRGCMGLTQLTLPDSITEIGDRALTYLVIKEIRLPSSLVYLGEDNMQSCSYLENIEISDNPTFSIINGMLVRDNSVVRFPPSKNVTELIIPSGIKIVNNNAFRDNSVLEFVRLEGIEIIKKGGFYGCSSLKKVQIASNIQKIEAEAFYNCPCLERIVLPKDCSLSIDQNAISKGIKIEYV